jgi:mannan endo-1,4-beta-mannosidase
MWLSLCLLWAGVLCSSLRVETAPAPPRTIPKANVLHFELDGETKYWAGTNAYWLGYLTNNADVDLVLDHMAQAELRIIRIWGFNDVSKMPTNGMKPQVEF